MNNKAISITNQVDEFDQNKIHTSRYFFVEVQGRRVEMTAKSNKQEYYNDIAVQLNSLQGKSLTKKDFFDAFLEGCINHIKKFGRLIVTDMHSQLNCTMHLVDATNNIFHTHIKSEQDGIELRNYYANACMQVLVDYIYVPHPFLRDANGMAKVIPLKEAANL